jgi:hypothetical protein
MDSLLHKRHGFAAERELRLLKFDAAHFGALVPKDASVSELPEHVFVDWVLSDVIDEISVSPHANVNYDAVLRRQEISFNQGAEWNALISTYIGTIPLSGDTPCAAKHIMSASPPDAQVRSGMAAKVGAAARHSQSAAPGAAARPFPTHPPI